MVGLRITGEEGWLEEPEDDIAGQGEAICLVGGIIWGKVWRMGCGGNSGTRWRTEAPINKTERRQRRAVRIMVPWPAVG